MTGQSGTSVGKRHVERRPGIVSLSFRETDSLFPGFLDFVVFKKTLAMKVIKAPGARFKSKDIEKRTENNISSAFGPGFMTLGSPTQLTK